MISGNNPVVGLIMRRSKNVPRETLLELHASFLHPPVHHVQRVAKCFTRNTSNRDEVLRRRKIGQPRSGVFHVKHSAICTESGVDFVNWFAYPARNTQK